MNLKKLKPGRRIRYGTTRGTVTRINGTLIHAQMDNGATVTGGKRTFQLVKRS
mgnify:CR=1 FL=1